MSQELIVKESGVFARAELDTQISTAKAYPRNPQQAIENAIELATGDEETAQSCFYVLARKDKDGGKKEIRGASIRLAEIVASCWGNIHAATRIVENDGRHITASGVVWDLEKNVKIEMQNKVSIRFGEKDGKGGYTANTDMQTVLSNAASAKALRNAIFKVIPKALVDRVLEKAMIAAVGDQQTINKKVTDIIDKFAKMGIDKQKILDYFGYDSIARITPEDYRSLIGVGTAIKEGHMKIDDAFSTIQEPKPAASNASDRLSSVMNPNPTLDANGLEVNATTGEVTKKFAFNIEDVKKRLLAAKDTDALDLAADMIRDTDPSASDSLKHLYKTRKEALKK